MILLSSNQWKCDINHRAWLKRGEDCSAEGRVGGLLRAYASVLPDLMAWQEVSLHMADLLMEKLRDLPTDGGERAQYEYVSGGDTPVVFRRDKLRLIESGFTRFPEAVPGLEGKFNNGDSKSCAWGLFEERATGRRLAFMSTHLWWKSSDPANENYQPGSAEARAWQIGEAGRILDGVAARYDCPAVIMGDLNAVLDSACLKRAFADGWREGHDLASLSRDETRGHHPCFAWGWERGTPGSFSEAIDHVLIKDAPKNGGRLTVNHFSRLTDEYFDKISDHYPLWIDAELE